MSRSFGLQTANDLLKKLEREYDRFCSSPHEDKSDHAFNFAITAWHMVDWVWHESMDKSGAAFGCEKFDHFHSKVRSECGALQICYEIATGSKHVILKPEKAKAVELTKTTTSRGGGVVRSVVSPVVMPVATSVTGSYPVAQHVIRLKAGGTVPARSVFGEALEYWETVVKGAET